MWLTTTEFVANQWRLYPTAVVVSWEAVQVTQKKLDSQMGKSSKEKSADTGGKAGPRAKHHLQYSTSPATMGTSSDQNGGEESGASTILSTPVLLSDYSVQELPSECSEESALDASGLSGSYANESSTNVIVSTALVARIQALEIENKALRDKVLESSMLAALR